jgi:hypothetical protein
MLASARSGLPGMAGGSAGFSTKSTMRRRSSTAITPKAWPRRAAPRCSPRCTRAQRHMVGQHQRVVHLVDVVAGQHHDVVGAVAGQDVLVLVDRVGRAAVPAFLVHPLLRRQQVDELVHLALQEGPAALQVAQQAVALVLRDDADAPDAGVQAVGQRESRRCGTCRRSRPPAWRGCRSGSSAGCRGRPPAPGPRRVWAGPGLRDHGPCRRLLGQGAGLSHRRRERQQQK